jgi:hypothetical protein
VRIKCYNLHLRVSFLRLIPLFYPITVFYTATGDTLS